MMTVATRPDLAAANPTNALAVVLTWTDIKNAEYEVVQRVCQATQNIGKAVYVIDNSGYILWSSVNGVASSRRLISAAHCDFVLSLHFESPRVYDIFSYTALWNPPDFYGDHATYQRTTAQLSSHSDLLSCHADIADAHGINILGGLGREPLTPLPTLFHSVPGPYPKPDVSAESRLFYIGINWERITGQPGRHQELLKQLDADDLINIYGPKRFLGVAPWEGFENYCGEIPFDGKSVVDKINKSGICLAFSSEVHQKSGIMSNRLFEGLAAGAVIIANPHPFIEKYFADCVYVVDDRVSPSALADRIRDLVLEIRKDVTAARERAVRGQARFLEKFTLEACLRDLFAGHPSRVAAFNQKMLGADEHEVTVLMNYTGRDITVIEDMLENLQRQRQIVVDAVLICDSKLESAIRKRFGSIEFSFMRSFSILSAEFYTEVVQFDELPRRIACSGPLFAEALDRISTPYFCVMQADDHWFGDHLATLAHSLAANEQLAAVRSNKISETLEGPRRVVRYLDTQSSALEDMQAAFYSRKEGGRYLYRSTLARSVPRHLIRMLDGLEGCALNIYAELSGQIASSNYASYVSLGWRQDDVPTPLYDERQQIAFLRDALRGDVRWFAFNDKNGKDLLAIAGAGGTSFPRVRPNHLFETRKGADGVHLLGTGFSTPEAEFTWIDGANALIQLELTESLRHLDLLLVTGARASSRTSVPQILQITINDTTVARREIAEGKTEFRVPVPDRISVDRTMSILLSLRYAEPVTDENGKVLDPRKLGLWVGGVGLVERTADLEVATLGFNQKYEVVKQTNYQLDGYNGYADSSSLVARTDDAKSLVEFVLAGSSGNVDLVVEVKGSDVKTDDKQNWAVWVNDNVIGNIPVSKLPQEVRFPLPPRTLRASKNSVSVGAAPSKFPPMDSESGPDIVPEILSVGLWQSNRAAEPMQLALDHMYELRESGDGVGLIKSGFSHEEADFVWIDGLLGELEFMGEFSGKRLEVALTVGGRSREGDQRTQTVMLVLNGTAIGRFPVGDALETVRVDVPESIIFWGPVSAQLRLQYADPVVGAPGSPPDNRLLGLRVSGFGIFEKKALPPRRSNLVRRILRRVRREIGALTKE